MSDSAKGPLAGYLFQFEKALLLLAALSSNDFVTIEDVDDIAVHQEDGTVLITVQAKHSIASSGSTFGDTSTALWRTLELWIDKLESNLFGIETEFVCTTNKKISTTALLYKIKNMDFDNVIKEVESLLHSQKSKLKEIRKEDPKGGSSLKKTIELIKKVLLKKELFKQIKKNIQIEDEIDAKQAFLNKVHLGSDTLTELQKDRIFESFYGWISYGSKAKWNNDKIAKFTKQSFDDRFLQIISNPIIINAIFRTKKSLGSITDEEILNKKRELFVKQIEDIDMNKEARERIVKNAIIDFIYSDIELKYIIDKGDYTEHDFECFLNECHSIWQGLVDQKIAHDITEYSEREKTNIAIYLYHSTMSKIKIEFVEGTCFTTSNEYVKNGCFLKLSNVPKIGWHPEWEKKYK